MYFNQAKVLVGALPPSTNLEGWSVNENDMFTRNGYSIGIDFALNFYILDPNGLKLNYSFSKVHNAIAKVNELLTPFIELEYKDIRFPLLPLNSEKLSSIFNNDVIVYNNGINIGSIVIHCDDVPESISVSDSNNILLNALEYFLINFLD